MPGQGGCLAGAHHRSLCRAPAARPRPCSALRGTVSTPLRMVPEGRGVGEAGATALTLWDGKPPWRGGILWGCAGLLAACVHLPCSA